MRKLLLSIALCTFVLTGCTQFEEPIPVLKMEEDLPVSTRSLSYQSSAENPYALANVQRAWNIVAQREGLNAFELEPTHKYVRFLPQDTTHWFILVDSLNLEIFPYPLDRTLTLEEIEEYKDTQDDGFAWQYCLLEPNFPMPTEMDSELLDYGYLQSEYTTRSVDYQLDSGIYDMVIDKSMEITEYLPPQTRAGDEWYPSAKITYVSDVAGEDSISLQHVRIVVNEGFNIAVKYTNADGEVSGMVGSGGNFKKAVTYNVVWESDQWRIRDKARGVATYTGETKRGKWECVISGDTETAMHATIHRALHAYYRETHDLAAGLVKIDHINVRAHYREYNKDGDNGYFQRVGVNRIHIFSQNDASTHRTRIEMLSTTFHELGHASHFQAVINTSGLNRTTHYKNAAKKIKESWARGVQYAYTASLYPNDYEDVIPFHGNYTAIVESLINQGATLWQLQGSIIGKTEWEPWRSAVKALGFTTNAIVDILFNDPLDVVRINIRSLVIDGPTSLVRNISTNKVQGVYTVPAALDLPNNMVLSSFTVSGSSSDRTVSTSLSTGKLTITFLTVSRFTITAIYILPSGVSYSVSTTVTVSDPFSATITGPDNPSLNTSATYTVPVGTALPTGVTLSSFTVSGTTTDRTSSVNLSTGKLTVTFKSVLLYTITAKYKLVGGTTYTCTKTIDKSSELAPPTLSIVAGPPIVATVTNHKAGATYEWVRDGVTLASTSSSVSFNVPLKPNLFTTVNLKCRMSYNGQTSDWNSYRVMLPPVGNTASIQVVQLTAAEAAAVEAEMQTQSATGSETTTDDSSEDFFSTF